MTTQHIAPPWGTDWKPEQQPTLPSDPARVNGKFAPGSSGNPAGRKKGVPNKKSPLEAQVAVHGEAIMAKVIEAALKGDLHAANIALQRISPALKAKAPAVTFELDPDAPLEAQARQILAAVSEGALDPETGRMLVETLHSFSALRVADELRELERHAPAVQAGVVYVKYGE